MLELEIKELQTLMPIDFNYEALKKELGESLKKYEGLIFTDETVNEAKQSRATLNKLAEAINNRKIELKKKFMEPYAAFEEKIKVLLGMIDQPVKAIDTQVKKFEQAKKDEKQKKIVELFEIALETRPDLKAKGILTLPMLMDDTWLNSGTTLKKVEEAIEARVGKFAGDLIAIESFKSEHEIALVEIYKTSMDLATVLREKTRFEELKKTADAAKAAAASKVAEQAPAQTATIAPTAPSTPSPSPTPTDEVKTIDFRVWATDAQLSNLQAYLVANQIRYGKPS